MHSWNDCNAPSRITFWYLLAVFTSQYSVFTLLSVLRSGQNCTCLHRKGWNQSKDWSPKEGHHHDPEWWEVARAVDDHNPLRAAASRPHHQEAAAGFLGDCSQDNPRRQAVAGNDLGLRCLQKGKLMHMWSLNCFRFFFFFLLLCSRWSAWLLDTVCLYSGLLWWYALHTTTLQWTLAGLNRILPKHVYGRQAQNAKIDLEVFQLKCIVSCLAWHAFLVVFYTVAIC